MKRPRYCPICGWERGDGHNWEAHAAELRADQHDDPACYNDRDYDPTEPD